MSKTTYKSNKTKTIVAVGLFSAFAYVCCVLFHFKASFLSFDLKDAVMTVGAMLFGPVYGFAMALIVGFIEFVTISSTGIYGLIMNVLSSTVFICVGSCIYSRKRTMTGALIGMIASIVSMTAVMMAANLVVTPFYMGVSTADVAAMIPTLLLPFNLTKGIFNAAIVFLIYKPISEAIRLAGFVSTTVSHKSEASIPTESTVHGGKRKLSSSYIITLAAAIIIAAAALVYFFVKLGGSFTIK